MSQPEKEAENHISPWLVLDARINRLEKLIYLVLITSAPNVLTFVGSLG